MNETMLLPDLVAADTIAERIRTRQRHVIPKRRHAGRHALAKGLHRLAAALDG